MIGELLSLMVRPNVEYVSQSPSVIVQDNYLRINNKGVLVSGTVNQGVVLFQFTNTSSQERKVEAIVYDLYHPSMANYQNQICVTNLVLSPGQTSGIRCSLASTSWQYNDESTSEYAGVEVTNIKVR